MGDFTHKWNAKKQSKGTDKNKPKQILWTVTIALRLIAKEGGIWGALWGEAKWTMLKDYGCSGGGCGSIHLKWCEPITY